MKQQDDIEKKFSESFRNFSKEPPAHVWEGIRSRLHPEQKPLNFLDHLVQFPGSFPRTFRIGFATVAASLLILLAVLYFDDSERHIVSGHAYAGDARLCRGTAFLFRINDKTKPFDSLEHFRSAVVNDQGFFRFQDISEGKFLLRVSPDGESAMGQKYHASWHVQHSSPDSAHIVVVGPQDVCADVHLVEKK